MPRKTGDDPTRYVWSPVRGKVHVESVDREHTLCGRSLTGAMSALKTTNKVEEVTCQKCASKVRT